MSEIRVVEQYFDPETRHVLYVLNIGHPPVMERIQWFAKHPDAICVYDEKMTEYLRELKSRSAQI